MRRRVFTSQPPGGDYILRSSGFAWDVRRLTDRDSAIMISAGERSKPAAVAAIRSLADRDKVDAWETVGNGDFSLIARGRASST